jgi:aspartyl-tRNA(Asn)/glutamyl-tRNA(Gln) amidotransferase subunit B
VNSFKFVKKAIQYEIRRQIKILESGERVTQETRLYDSQLDETRPMRSKEFANDYRYFPEPDLLPVVLDEGFIKSIKDLMPELSEEKEKRFIRDYKLSDYDANVLSVDPNLSNFFEEVVVRSRNPKLATNWIMGELSAFLNKDNLSILETKVDSINLGNLLSRIEDSTISGKIAKEVFEEMWNSEKSPDEIIQEKGLKQVTDSSEIEKIINQVLEQNQSQLEKYKSGKEKLFGFFVGQVMKASRGKANPEQVNKLLEERLKE